MKIENKISSFINEWLETKNEFYLSIKYSFLNSIYTSIYSQLFNQYVYKSKRYGLKGQIIHIKWYFLWSLKWVLFLKLKGKKIILTALLKDRNNSQKTILELLNSSNGKYTFINYSVIYNSSLLVNPYFFCYPHTLYNPIIKRKQGCSIINVWEKDLDNLSQKHFKRKLSYDIKSDFNSTLNNYESFKYLLKKIFSNGEIKCLIQDMDFIAERVIFCYAAKEENIKTISLDHSVIFFDHQYKKVFSDYFFVWGQSQKDRLLDVSEIDHNKISLIGNFDKKFNWLQGNKQRNTWIYILSAHDYPMFRTKDGSHFQSIELFEKLYDFIQKRKLNVDLLVKLHPSDKIENYKKIEKYVIADNIWNYLKNAQLIISEESTLLVDCLQLNTPIIFLKSSNLSSRMQKMFSYYGEMVLAKDEINENILDNILKITPDQKKRKSLFEYFYSPISDTDVTRILQERIDFQIN